MKIPSLFRSALVAASLLAAFSASSFAQVRQTSLWIDDGTGVFMQLIAAPGGGTITLPNGTGQVLIQAPGGSGKGVSLQTSTPGTAETGNFNITGTAIMGALSSGATTIVGTTQINWTGTAGTQIGNGSGNISIKGNNVDIEDFVAGSMTLNTTGAGTTSIGNSAGTTINAPIILSGLSSAAPTSFLAVDGTNHIITSSSSVVTGSGTQNTLPLWNNAGGTTLGDSKLSDNGTTLSYAGTHINSATDYEIGGTRYIHVTGTHNTFFGNASGQSVTGSDNTGMGYWALQGLSSGTSNVAIGSLALSAFGLTGSNNVAIGYDAAPSNSGSQDNVAIGSSTLQSHTSGNANVAIGTMASDYGTGAMSTAVGFYALTGQDISHVPGSFNTGVGAYVMTNMSGGAQQNTGIGFQAGYNNSTGNDNVYVGYTAGTSNTTGSNNTFVGYSTSTSPGNLTNSTALGNGALITQSNEIQLGNSSVTLVNTSGAITSTNANGITTGGNSVTGKLKISDGAVTANYATINAPNAGGFPVFNLPTEGGPGPYTLATTSQVLGHIAETFATTGQYTTSSGGEQLLATDGTATDISIALQPKGAGALQAQLADGGLAGGNARGTNAVDWQMSRGSATQVASGFDAVIAGGASNTATGTDAVVGGGYADYASGSNATVAGGDQDSAKANFATVGGGYKNLTTDVFSTVAGGNNNTASGNTSTVAGGQSDTASGYSSFVGGGGYNKVSNDYTTVSGGGHNTASGVASTVGGGQYNVASFSDATVAGGQYDTASGQFSIVSGGNKNLASGAYATVLGGENMKISGPGSLGFFSDVDVPTQTMEVSTPQVAVFGGTDLWLANNDNIARALYFYAPYSTSGAFPGTAKYVGFKAGAVGTSVIWTLPTSDGGNGDVLKTNGSGALSWYTPTSGWSLTGNSGTTVGTNFIGTTDAVDLEFKVNSTKSGYIGNTNGNTVLGYGAATGNGSNTTAIGWGALGAMTTGFNNTAIGASAGAGVLGGFNNVFVGPNTGVTVTSGTFNTFVGNGANAGAAGITNATALGNGATVASSNSIQLGNASVSLINTGGAFNTSSLSGYEIGGTIVLTSSGLGSGVTSSSLTSVGTLGALTVTGTTNINASGAAVTTIGNTTTAASSAAINVGSSGSLTLGGIASGTPTNGYLALDGSNHVVTATPAAGWSLTGNSGTTAGTNFIGTTDNVALEFKVNNTIAGILGSSTSGNTGLGYSTLVASTGTNNTAIGHQALTANTSGGGHTAVGYQALFSFNSSDSWNTALGDQALYYLTSGFHNVGLGDAVGNGTFHATGGSNNTFIGSVAGPGSATQHSRSTAIGAYATVDEDDALVLGEINGINSATATVKVGIGVNAPAALLSVGTSSALQVDASGNLTTTGTISTGGHIIATSSGSQTGITGANPAVTVTDKPVFILVPSGTAPTGTIALTMPSGPPATGDMIVVINQCLIPAQNGSAAETVPAGGSRTFYYDGTAWQ